MKTIIYFYTEIMPYQTTVYEEFSCMGYSVIAFYLDHEKKTPFIPVSIENVKYISSSRYTRKLLLDFVIREKPVLLMVAGWSDSKYNFVSAEILRKRVCPVVCAFDTQFLWRTRQILGIMGSKFIMANKFSHIWIPGFRQYEFARLLGYKRERIIFNSLSGNTSLFLDADISHKVKEYPKRFIYVGRFSKEKGLDLLINVWKSIYDKQGWTLTLIGTGEKDNELRRISDIDVLPFVEQKGLVEIAEKAGCFILPSYYEPWAVVLHEFSAAGLPIICSDACGAADTFVINGFNGFVFNAGEADDLSRYMLRMISLPLEKLIEYSKRSRQLSTRITPKISAMSLLSILEK